MAVAFNLTPRRKRNPYLTIGGETGPAYTPVEEAPDLEIQPFDYENAVGTTPTAENSYGGAGQLPTMTSVATMRKQADKAQAENSSAIANYNANKDDNGLDYTTQYLNKDGKGMTKEVAKSSPVVNSENEVVNNFATQGEEEAKPQSNVQFLQSQGLDTSAQMQKDYDEYMKYAPEYVSEEEQARRLRASQSAKTVADLGSLASAFANLWGTNKGAYNQTVAYANAPDYNTYINQWTKQRNAYKTYAQKGREYVYNKVMQAAKDKYQQDLNALNIEYKQAQIDYTNAKTTAQQDAAALRMQQALDRQKNADRNYELNAQKANAYMQHMANMDANNSARTAIAATKANNSSSGSGGSKKASQMSWGGHTYTFGNSKDNANIRGNLAGLLGIELTEGYPKKAKSPAQIDKEIGAKWNDDCDRYIRSMGGVPSGTYQSSGKTATAESTPKVDHVTSDGKHFGNDYDAAKKHQDELDKAKNKNTKASAKSSNASAKGNKSGSTGGWGSSISRHNKK